MKTLLLSVLILCAASSGCATIRRGHLPDAGPEDSGIILMFPDAGPVVDAGYFPDLGPMTSPRFVNTGLHGTYFDAQTICWARGMTVPVVSTPALNTELTDFLLANRLEATHIALRSVATATTSPACAASFTVWDNTATAVSWTNWYPSHPMCTGGSAVGTCGETWGTGGFDPGSPGAMPGMWLGLPCDHNPWIVCERP